MKMKKVESELDITNRIIKILEKNDDISKLGAREIRISLDNIRKLLNQNKEPHNNKSSNGEDK